MLLVVTAWMAPGPAAGAGGTQVVVTFEDATTTTSTQSGDATLRRTVNIDVRQLRDVLQDASASGSDVNFVLLDDLSAVVTAPRWWLNDASALGGPGGGDTSWNGFGGFITDQGGSIVGDAVLSVVEHRKDILVTGSFTVGDRVIRIEHGDGSLHSILERSASSLPEVDSSSPATADGGSSTHSHQSDETGEFSMASSSVTIDVLVLYTPAALAAAGGDIFANRVVADFDNANYAHPASWVSMNWRLAGIRRVEYVSQGMTTDLQNLRFTSDPHLNYIHDWRNAVSGGGATGADVVVLYGTGYVASVGFCGAGYLTTASSAAFSVVDAHSGCIDNYTFAHEVGHNMGSHHNVEDADSPGVFPYSHGWRVNGEFRTVMAYPCPEISCGARRLWSNPGISINGHPAGDADTANNAQSLEGTKSTVASHRTATSGVFANGPYWYEFAIAQGGHRRAAGGGYVLDGYGGVQPTGGAPAVSGNPYWTGQDIARGMDTTGSSGSPTGITADYWGGIHRWGPSASSISTAGAPYWQGQDIVEGGALVQMLLGWGGVTVDSWGGLHGWGGAILNTANAPYWPGQDIVRDVDVLQNGSGGYTLDLYGGIHAWGAAPPVVSSSATYTPGVDWARGLTLNSDLSGGYVIDRFGAAYPFSLA